MFLRTLCSLGRGALVGFIFALGLLFASTSVAEAATCNCTCRGQTPTATTLSACTSCASMCESRCSGTGVGPVAVSCREDSAPPAPAPPTPAPSTPSPSGSSGSGGSRRRPSGTSGTNTTNSTNATNGTAGVAATGICLYNCTTPRATTCTSNEECVTACNSNCGTLVGNSTCATNPAPRCAPAGADGRRTCIFECQVAPPDSCTVGDQGNSVCGSRSAQICRPPAGTTGGTAPTITVSTTVQPRCVSPRGSPSEAGGSPSGSQTGSEDRATSGGSSRETFRLNNPVTGAATIPAVIGKAVRALMGLVGAIALLMFVIGGVRWILSAGDPKDVQAAQDLLKNASIGLLIIFLSYTVITVGMGLVNELGGQGTPETPQTTNGSNATNNSRSTNGTNATNATNDTNRTPPPSTGPSGTCRCAPSGLASVLTGAATEDQIRQAESACTGARAGARFDRSAFTCTGPASESECRQVQTELNRQLPTGISAECTWSRS